MRARDLETLEFPRVLDAIAALARSAAGRQAVLELRPTSERAEAERRLDLLAELVALASEAGRPPTADVPLLAPALAAAAPDGATLEPRRLAEVRDLLAAARQLRAYLRRDPAAFPRLAAEGEAIDPVPEVSQPLGAALDETGQVRDDASPTLAAARAVTRELRGEMEARLLGMVRDPDMGSVIGEQYVTVRNGRSVVPIRTAAAGGFAGVVQDRSASGETVFMEPLSAVELNNRLLLAAKDEEAEERRVRGELTALVRAHAARLEAAERALAAADARGAAAQLAARHGCTRPVLGAPDVSLPAARHPLLLEAGRPVVAVDLRVPADRRGLAVTGPNAGGKTVALKTLGLCTLMAHAGLFVPAAEGSRLPLCTAVLVDIGDEQSIDRDLSTFTGHIENLARIAAAAGPGALVLLDEPGAGTDPVEGAALAVGLLTDLLARGPRVVFTSHFPQVKTFALAEPALDVAAFDVDPTTGAPRFKLAYHTVGQSLALPIARRPGLPARALETSPTRPPVPGDLVEVAGRGIRGELVEIAGERARIQRGGLRFEVPSGQLRVVGDAPARERVAIEVDRPADAPAEINLIGQRVRDAIDALAAFLDRAVRAGLSEVRVVHGIGSGALRRAVHEFLESSPYCAGFRESEPAAGGAGVTIAELG